MKHRISVLTGVLFLTSVGLAGNASAQVQEPLAENTTNMVQIGLVAYFEQLGWDFQTATWTGAVPDASYLGGGAAVAILDGYAYEFHSDLPYNSDLSADPNTDSMVLLFSGLFCCQYNNFSLHGTHVSGIVGAGLNGLGSTGVAPETRLLNFAIFDDIGWVGADEDYVLDLAVGYGATVANMSYGPITAGDFSSSASLKAINAHKNEIVVVKAAGNDGVTLLDENVNLRGKSTPLTNLIVVGSVDNNNEITWYSNTPGDSCIILKGACRVKIQDIFLVAPGGDAIISNGAILSDENGFIDGIWSTSTPYTASGSTTDYYRISGTSMAAPHVVGAVALLHGRWPALKLDPLATRNILFDTATDLGAPGTDGIYGQGLLNVYAAMNPIGDPTIGGGGGDSGDSNDDSNGGKKGSPPGKNKNAATSWLVSETQLLTNRTFAALSETDFVLSMFDDYQRDFPILFSSLVQPRFTRLSSKLERMLLGPEPISESPLLRSRLGYESSAFSPFGIARGEPPQRDIMVHFDLVGSSAQLFVGQGNAASLFYQPAVSVGSMSLTDAEISGVNPVLGFATGEFFTGISVDQGQAWRFALGFTQNKNGDELFDTFVNYDASAFAAAATYRVSDNMNLNLTVTRLSEDRGVLGGRGMGAFTFGDSNTTNSVTSSWDWRATTDIELTASYTIAMTDGTSAGVLSIDDGLLSDAFHVAVAKHNAIFENDRFAFSVSQPLRVRDGYARFVADRALDANGVMQTQTTLIPLEPSGREIDLQVEYGVPLGATANLSTFAYWAVDSGHIRGQTESGIGLLYRLDF